MGEFHQHGIYFFFLNCISLTVVYARCHCLWYRILNALFHIQNGAARSLIWNQRGGDSTAIKVLSDTGPCFCVQLQTLCFSLIFCDRLKNGYSSSKLIRTVFWKGVRNWLDIYRAIANVKQWAVKALANGVLFCLVLYNEICGVNEIMVVYLNTHQYRRIPNYRSSQRLLTFVVRVIHKFTFVSHAQRFWYIEPELLLVANEHLHELIEPGRRCEVSGRPEYPSTLWKEDR